MSLRELRMQEYFPIFLSEAGIIPATKKPDRHHKKTKN